MIQFICGTLFGALIGFCTAAMMSAGKDDDI